MNLQPINLYDLTRDELGTLLVRWELSPVHAARLWNYLYLELADSFAAMPELPARVRARLEAGTRIGTLPVALETDSRTVSPASISSPWRMVKESRRS